jgi:hypothetical protein
MDLDREIAGFEGYAHERQWAKTTRERIVYNLRAALTRIADPTDPDEVGLYHASLAHRSRRLFRSTWRFYGEYRAARGILPYPAAAPVGKRGKPTRQERCSLPPEVVAALGALMRDRIPSKALAAMTWGDVLGHGASTRLRAVLDRGGRPSAPGVDRAYAPLSTAGRVALEDLHAWAGGGADPHPVLPLVPMRPGSHIGASAGLIRQAVKDAE